MPGRSAVFLQHDAPIQVPDAEWYPVAFNVPRTIQGDSAGILGGFNFPSATSVAVASNGAVLPVGTINVVSTAGFSFAGYLLIRVGTADRVVRYTGKNATQFTGCTLGVGTLTTGDAVRQGLVTLTPPPGELWSVFSEWAWTSNATGVRGIRLRDQSTFQLEAGGDVRGAVATPAAAPLRSWMGEQPASPGAGLTIGVPFRIELYQNSTTVGGLATLSDPLSLGHPRIVCAHVVDL